MNILVDLIIVAIIGLCIWGGYRKGLIGVAFKIISFFVAIIIALVLYKPVGTFIVKNTNWDEQIAQSIKENSKAQIEETSNEEEANSLTTEAIVEYINKNIENAADKTKEALAEEFAQSISITIINAGTFIVLFLIANIILVVLKVFSDLIAKLPILKQFNKLGGVLFGLLKGLFLVYLAVGIISVVAPLVNANNITKPIKQSIIGNVMYENNVLVKMLF